ncbi:4-coumarate--CoA ligase 1-like [Neodiprion fabricii]|uniref:4-coumarate--CoA ligase 1-like n=1 Tax=Neodiprion fabricii TaxID=2872261 RepID=UPI001ED927E7|nr:4-coumarate--CoA ligase 1-like [Neodiprion fabricii]
MRDRSVRCALWMKANGLLPGDVVMICDHHHLDLAMPCLAALYLGAIFNPLHVDVTGEDLYRMMKITTPKMAFVNEELAGIFAEAIEKMTVDIKLVTFGRRTGFLQFEKIITEQKIDEVQNYRCTPIKSSNETAVIVWTSGSSGVPKGVALPHSAILGRLKGPAVYGANALNFTSLGWLSEVLSMLEPIVTNETRFLAPTFEEYTACALIEKLRTVSLFLSPFMINRLIRSDALDKYDLSSLRRIITSGCSLSVVSRKALKKKVPHALIAVIYGMSETGGAFSVQDNESKPTSTGVILPNRQLKVVDPDTGRVLGANQMGELCLKTCSMMKYYWKNPEATVSVLDEDGWLHSGDLGYYDEDGEIFVVDRLKDLISCPEYNVCPADIENVLLSHPGVKEVAVVAMPHPVDIEQPIAFVVRTDASIVDKQVTEQELIDFVAAKLPDGKRLRGGVRFLEHLPKTSTDKVRRSELRELARRIALT